MSMIHVYVRKSELFSGLMVPVIVDMPSTLAISLCVWVPWLAFTFWYAYANLDDSQWMETEREEEKGKRI